MVGIGFTAIGAVPIAIIMPANSRWDRTDQRKDCHSLQQQLCVMAQHSAKSARENTAEAASQHVVGFNTECASPMCNVVGWYVLHFNPSFHSMPRCNPYPAAQAVTARLPFWHWAAVAKLGRTSQPLAGLPSQL
jgi:hypothetical protein